MEVLDWQDNTVQKQKKCSDLNGMVIFTENIIQILTARYRVTWEILSLRENHVDRHGFYMKV